MNALNQKYACAIAIVLAGTSLHANAQSLDNALRNRLSKHGVKTPDAGGGHSDARIELGQALFFDRELSGNRDTSCATCHHPTLGSGDGLALPVGTGPKNPGAIGLARQIGDGREFIPRNAPEVFNRGSDDWKSMFWDGRISKNKDGSFVSPAGDELLDGLTSALYIQAMLPVTSREEMRGHDGDVTFEGQVNEIAQVPDGDLRGIWSALMARLWAIPKYQEMFAAAYPDKDLADMTFADAANAIGAFEIAAFTMLDTPFDQYLGGDNKALSKQQKRGALLFYGRAKCVTCHSGPLMTDQKHWNLAVPQLGPGKADYAPWDLGRFLNNQDFSDLFAFRTPPLRNIEKTGPYMHNGAFKDLKSVIRHHANPFLSGLTYRGRRQLDQEELRGTVLRDRFTFGLQMATLDSKNLPWFLSRRDVRDLESFLKSLTAPNYDARLLSVIPENVPSGLPVEEN